MKKIKYGRQIGYGLAGLAIGIIVYVMLVADIPSAVEAKSSLIEFITQKEEPTSEYVLDDENYNGEVVPFLKYGGYRVSPAQFIQYEKNETVRFGKVNPTFYYVKESATQDSYNKDGNGLIKGSANKIYHVPGSAYYDQTTNPVEWFKTIQEAEAAGYRAPKSGQSGKTGEPSDSSGGNSNNKNNNATGGNVIEGFNIHDGQVETGDVTHIRKAFIEQAQLPLDINFLNISSKFGIRIDPIIKQRAYHVGVDFATKDIEGAYIYSALAGEVVEVDENYGTEGLGNYIVIDHGDFQTLYAHMKDGPIHKKGDKVKKGEILGVVGSTGRSTGPHLHFEVGIGGLKFDGIEFLLHVIDTNGDGKVSIDEVRAHGLESIDSDHWLYDYMVVK